jgi:hypothetical protein
MLWDLRSNLAVAISPNPLHFHLEWGCIILPAVNRLTKKEQLVLCISLGLLLTGWAVKAYRTAHPPAAAKVESKP